MRNREELLKEERMALRRALDQADPEVARRIREFVSKAKVGDPPHDHSVCVLAAHEPGSVRGSKQVRCDVCGKPVWIAPSTQDMIERRPSGSPRVYFLCAACTEKHGDKLSDEKFISSLAKKIPE